MLARQAGAPPAWSATQKTYTGVTHEFFGMGAVVDKAKEAEQMAADALKKGFDT